MVLGTVGTEFFSHTPCILVIEDEADLRNLLREELAALGYRPIVAQNGAEGLKQIQMQEPDVVICDRAMPTMTGSQLLERLRAVYPQYKTMPFIFLTALTGASNKTEVEELHPFAYMEKPLDFEKLHATIKKALLS